MIAEIPVGYQPQHRRLWEEDARERDFYQLAVRLNPNLSYAEFCHAWQWCRMLHHNYQRAKVEFLMAVNQTY